MSVSSSGDFTVLTLARQAPIIFDVLVIGGGITGAASRSTRRRGLRTALVERDDFASGTSSKSSKLVHGGLRYLQQGDCPAGVRSASPSASGCAATPRTSCEVLPFLIPIFTRDGLVQSKLA
jgi:glycerol-3-phosphate dehydrogenase